MKINMPKDINVRVSDHFVSDEYQCKCSGKCTYAEVEEELIEYVESLRKMYGGPLYITSGYRCTAHNSDVGGVENSTHVRGMAVDIVCDDLDRLALIVEGVYPEFSLGRYETFIHTDIRRDGRRWGNESTAETSYLPEGPDEESIDDMLARIERDILDD